MQLYGDKLKLARKQKNLTIEKLSGLMGVNRVTLYRWERGDKTPAEEKIYSLAKILNVSVDEISDLEPEAPVSDVQYSDAVQSWISFESNDKELEESKINLLLNGVLAVKKELSNTKLIINALKSSTSSIFYIKDTNLNYITANVAFLQNLSLHKHYTVLNKTDYDFFSSKEAELNDKEDRQVLLSGKSIINIERHIPGSRKKKWGLISKIPIFDNENRIEGIVGSFVDISGRKRAEYMRELLELNIDAMTDGVGLYSFTDKKYLYLNKAIEDITGYKRSTFYEGGRDFWVHNCVHPDDRKVQGKRAMSIHRNAYIQYRIVKPDGETRWLGAHTTYKNFADKECSLTITRDITDKVNAEKRRKLLEGIINSVEDVFWIVQYDEEKRDFNYLFSSDSLKKLYGLSYEGGGSLEEYIQKQPIVKSQQFNKLIKIPSHKFPLSEITVITRADGTKIKVRRRVFKQPEDNIYFGISSDITEEAKNQEEKELLYELLSNTDDIIGVLDIDENKYIYINSAIEKFTGYTPEEIYNDPEGYVENCCTPEYIKKREEYIKNGKWPEKVNFDLIHKDGSVRICECRIKINNIFNKRCVVFIVRDITEKTEDENKIRHLEMAVNSTSAALSIFDMERHKYFYTNEAAGELWGYPCSVEEFLKTGNHDFWLDNLVNEDDRKKILKYIETGKFPKRFEYLYKMPDGSLRWIESITTVTKYLGRNCLTSISRNITEQKESDELNRIIANAGLVSEALIIVEKKTGRYLYLNKAVEKIYGYPLAKFYESDLSFWLNICLHPDDKNKELEYLSKRDWPGKRTLRIVRPNGDIRYIETALLPEITRKDQKCVVTVDSDITEKVNYEKRIKELEEKLKNKS